MLLMLRVEMQDGPYRVVRGEGFNGCVLLLIGLRRVLRSMCVPHVLLLIMMEVVRKNR